ncbi:lanthionine synthetase C family protein [Sorangium sp. So ce1335]|uniref:lanthionine synthetase C family protein n=1 Tax=Sorangium sp. So ce1335 TaxID=3133335 RepID=UPI003F622821
MDPPTPSQSFDVNRDAVTAAAQAIALEVARRLKDDDTLERARCAAVQQSPYPELARWQPQSISHGDAGLAVLFGYLEACFPGQGWDIEARRRIEIAARSVDEADGVGVSLFGGLSGVAYAAWYLSRGGRRYRHLSTTLDEAICSRVEATADALDATSGGCPVRLFDLIGGITGAGAYLLCRLEQQRTQRTLERILRCLVSLTDEEDGLPRWRTPRHQLVGEQQARHFPDGNLNCGLAHGIPGPLGLMALAASRGVSVPGMEEGIERIVAWLMAHRVDDRRGVNWTDCYPLPGRGGPPAKPRPGRTAWCYGSPGLSRALYLAGRALAKPAWCQVAIDAMRSAVTRPVEERYIPSPTFCHGVAGLLQIALRFALDTGLSVFGEASRALLAQLVQAYEPASILGFRSVAAGGTRVDDPGLLDGAPGVCLTMLATTTPAPPIWDRIFLLS